MVDRSGRRTVHYTAPAELPPDCDIYQESKTFRREMPRLLAEGHEGKFALVKGEEIVGIFDTFAAGMDVGYEKFLGQPFIVQPIHEWVSLHISMWTFRPCRS